MVQGAFTFDRFFVIRNGKTISRQKVTLTEHLLEEVPNETFYTTHLEAFPLPAAGLFFAEICRVVLS